MLSADSITVESMPKGTLDPPVTMSRGLGVESSRACLMRVAAMKWLERSEP
jgi:hypothetical protein